MKVWGDLKKGDQAIQVYLVGERDERRHDCVVKSVGHRWITVTARGGQNTKYDVENGYGEFGFSLHTETTFAEARRRNTALLAVRRYNWNNVETDVLVAITNLLAQTD